MHRPGVLAVEVKLDATTTRSVYVEGILVNSTTPAVDKVALSKAT
jgi:hypothetical protein